MWYAEILSDLVLVVLVLSDSVLVVLTLVLSVHLVIINGCIWTDKKFFFWFGGILRSSLYGRISRLPEQPCCLLYSRAHHSQEGFIHLKTGWAQDDWLQWLDVNMYFHFDISRWLKNKKIQHKFWMKLIKNGAPNIRYLRDLICFTTVWQNPFLLIQPVLRLIELRPSGLRPFGWRPLGDQHTIDKLTR